MRITRLGLVTGLLALGATACGGPQPCPEIDEEALAERVAEIVLARLEDRGEAGTDKEIAGPPPDEPDPEPIADSEADDQQLDEEGEQEQTVEVFHVPVDGSPSTGPDDALVTVVMFADIQCPYCVRAYHTVKSVRARFGDDVRIVWKNHPLPFHEEAMQSHRALMEARAQKGDAAAFAMLELMFDDLTHLELDDLEDHARKLKLSLPRFRKAIRNDKHSAAIAKDLALAERVGVRGTPTFFVNGVKLVGAGTYYTFFHAVGDALQRAKRLVDDGVPRDRVYAEIIRDGRGGSAER